MTAVEFIEPLSHDEGVKNATDLFRATYGEERLAYGPHRAV